MGGLHRKSRRIIRPRDEKTAPATKRAVLNIAKCLVDIDENLAELIKGAGHDNAWRDWASEFIEHVIESAASLRALNDTLIYPYSEEINHELQTVGDRYFDSEYGGED